MNREDILKLGVAEDLVDKIMALHGADIESHKTKLSTAQAEIDGLKKQVGEANTAIEGFKKLDPDALQKAADEWKAKAEQAEKDAQAQVAQLKFDHALDGALTGAKAKNAKAVKALLDASLLKLNEADGSIIGLDEQLKKVKEGNDFLFESDQPTPKIVLGGTSKTVIGDPVIIAARKAAGLPIEGAK